MESLDLSKFPEIKLPRFLKVKQNFTREKIEDIEGEVRAKIAPFLNDLTGKRIAIGVGSRGVANIAKVTKTVVDSLKEAGAKPFIIPVMGSHGGATPEGQTEVLASYGITAETMGVEIDASVDVETIGEYEPGLAIYVAKSALEADGIVIIPRIKPHTCFRGKV
ncbi:MAG TPA: lactate racemase domain-containing protein, partial [Clostridia bacterium]|nr:lactate racemase domain-containing protein [Clostridia bacterium]